MLYFQTIRYGGILLPPSCKIVYVNMRHNNIPMRHSYGNMQHNYVDMQHNYVNMQNNYVPVRPRLCTCIMSTPLPCMLTLSRM